ncbi:MULTISPECIES: hypothetical protein [unclassified Actinobaculum]|uniref:hypothetical protein n=1 Tax=unclassified Actinobaculum TaxID=2609299 RepID=UPI0013DD8B88|nr:MULTISPECIES: hypothetical protein [unclassified Actinobaculum]
MISPRVPLLVGGIGNALLYVITGGTTAILGSRWLGLAEGWMPTRDIDINQ